MYFDQLLIMIAYTLEEHGISSRSIMIFSSNNAGNLTGRETIYDEIILQAKNTHFLV